MSWWVQEYYQAGLIAVLLSHIFWVIFSITMHELAHGWAAIWQGDDTPIRYKRMTMNPLVHMGPTSLIAFAVVGIAWGVMPVEPSRFRWRRKGRIVVSGAGPAMNFLLAIVSLILLVIWLRVGPVRLPLYQHLATFFFVGTQLNLVLMLFNLLPVPPLDGADILSGLSFRMYQLYQHANAQMVGMFVVLALMLSGILGFIWIAGSWVTATACDLLGSILGNPPIQHIIAHW